MPQTSTHHWPLKENISINLWLPKSWGCSAWKYECSFYDEGSPSQVADIGAIILISFSLDHSQGRECCFPGWHGSSEFGKTRKLKTVFSWCRNPRSQEGSCLPSASTIIFEQKTSSFQGLFQLYGRLLCALKLCSVFCNECNFYGPNALLELHGRKSISPPQCKSDFTFHRTLHFMLRRQNASGIELATKALCVLSSTQAEKMLSSLWKE